MADPRLISNIMPVRVVPVDTSGADVDYSAAVPVTEAHAVDIGDTLIAIRDEIRAISAILLEAYQLNGSLADYRSIGREQGDQAA